MKSLRIPFCLLLLALPALGLAQAAPPPPARPATAEAPAAQPAAPAAPAAQTNPPAAEPSVKDNSVTTEEISGETQFEIPGRENGKTETVALKDLITSHLERENGLNPEDHLEVDGKQVLVSEIVAGYKANAAKTNAEEEDDEEKKKKAKENAAPAPAPAAPAAAPAPQHFKVLMNARDNASAIPTSATPDDLSSRCNRGAERYGKPGKN